MSPLFGSPSIQHICWHFDGTSKAAIVQIFEWFLHNTFIIRSNSFYFLGVIHSSLQSEVSTWVLMRCYWWRTVPLFTSQHQVHTNHIARQFGCVTPISWEVLPGTRALSGLPTIANKVCATRFRCHERFVPCVFIPFLDCQARLYALLRTLGWNLVYGRITVKMIVKAITELRCFVEWYH